MIVHVEFMQEKKIMHVIEVARLRKDGSFYKWVTDDIWAWISKPGNWIKVSREHKKIPVSEKR